ncbi:MAG: thioredoxin fold domain-containing protein [Gemmatimonadetes bacterium]|nr:thioredoxin fold domain-containing protein [Gemmatimonadota bacterium]
MDLGRDAFTITYDPDRVDVEAIMCRIRSLGYKPEKAAGAAGEARAAAYNLDDVPAPVSDALSRARASNRLTLIEFYAAWCDPCKVLETTVLGDPRVQDVLGEYVFIKVNTDKQVEPSDYFHVVGLPTLVVIDAAGTEVYRLEGMVEAEELARRLSQFAASSHR